MSINYKLSIAAALTAIALGSAAYASDASETYGGDASGRLPPSSFVGGGIGSFAYQPYAAHRTHHRLRGVDAYGRAGGPAFPANTRNSMRSPGSLNYEPDFNH
jgi:hypothetical protein